MGTVTFKCVIRNPYHTLPGGHPRKMHESLRECAFTVSHPCFAHRRSSDHAKRVMEEAQGSPLFTAEGLCIHVAWTQEELQDLMKLY